MEFCNMKKCCVDEKQASSLGGITTVLHVINNETRILDEDGNKLDILEIENKILIDHELLCLKWIKLTSILLYLFIHHRYHYIKQEYNCYQMEYA